MKIKLYTTFNLPLLRFYAVVYIYTCMPDIINHDEQMFFELWNIVYKYAFKLEIKTENLK